MRTYIFFLGLLFLIIGNVMRAQIPINFEFLDHSDVETFLLDYEVIGNDILYVESNTRRCQTSIKLSDGNNEITELLDNKIRYCSEADIFIDDDGIPNILIYGNAHAAFDDFRTFIYHCTFELGVLNIDTINIPQYNSLETTMSVAVDSIGGIYALTSAGELYYSLQGETLIGSFPFINGLDRLFKNNRDDIFLYTYWENTISYFNGTDFIERYSQDEKMRDVESIGDKNMVLNNSKIMFFDDKFENIVDSLDVPEFVNSLDHLIFEGDSIFTLTMEDDNCTFYSIDESGNSILEFRMSCPHEEVNDFRKIGDDQYLVSGQFSTGKDFSNMFFRNTSKELEFLYDRPSVTIEQFEFTDLGESIEMYGQEFFKYNLDYMLSNQGKGIDFFNVFSSRVIDYTNGPYLNLPNSDILLSGELVVIENFPYNFWPTKPDSLRFFIPGADNKINNGFKVFNASLFSSNSNVEEDGSMLYPNPTSNYLFVEDSLIGLSARIIDLNGRVVKSIDSMEKRIVLEDLEVGTFFLIILDPSGKESSAQFIKY